MGRPRKNERLDVESVDRRDERDTDRDEDRDAFEQAMPADSGEAATYIPAEDWPEGKALRWVAIEVANQPFNTNWSQKTRAGWTPVLRGVYPRIDARYPSIPMPGMPETNQKNSAIIFGGLCLCMRDMRLEKRDKQSQQKETRESLRTIETYLEGGSANFPRADFGSTPVEYERGKQPVQFKE
jgi:hypothetical protein